MELKFIISCYLFDARLHALLLHNCANDCSTLVVYKSRERSNKLNCLKHNDEAKNITQTQTEASLCVSVCS